MTDIIPAKDPSNDLHLLCRKCGKRAGEPTGEFEKNRYRSDRGYYDVYRVCCEACGHHWWSEAVVPPNLE